MPIMLAIVSRLRLRANRDHQRRIDMILSRGYTPTEPKNRQAVIDLFEFCQRAR